MERHAREGLREAIALEHRLFTEMQHRQREADRWQARAELAARRNEDALARAALERAHMARRHAGDFQAQYEAQAAAIRKLKASFDRMPAAPRIDAGQETLEGRFQRMTSEDRAERDLHALQT
ncbi:MAG: PspA/IM30 family protein, partial [Chloroflexi bacterium]|nr:PspA/IM30 family protein [Chloroflexota bacterium]